MNIAALLTSAGINIGLCALFLSLYSVLRKQPANVYVYFGRRLAQEHSRCRESFNFERLVPSPSWIIKAWEYTEDEILAVAGLDAVVFLRILVFSIRIFSIAAVVCVFGVLPLNYFGQEMHHEQIPSESLDVFTIANVKQRSHWLWVHCIALYIISCAACVLLYFEYKSIARMRLAHMIQSSPNPSHFAILVRGIPKSTDESISDSIKRFFTNYHGSSYLSHQVIFRTGKFHKFLYKAETVYKKFVRLTSTVIDERSGPTRYRCGLCGVSSSSFKMYHEVDVEVNPKKADIANRDTSRKERECLAAFVFFKTRYAAVVASKLLQSSNPMLWVTHLAPEPHDVYWSNLWIPYRQLWFRRVSVLLGSIIFMLVFLIPVTFVQGLTQLDQLEKIFPFLQGILKKKFTRQIVTGYLPSVILLLFLYSVPPTMMLFSALEGCISRSGRKKSACRKVLYFTIWNIFFANVLSGTAISELTVIASPKEIPERLATAVSMQANFFITYVLTSGWASLASEVLQSFALIYNLVKKVIFGYKDEADAVPSFPYHTEVPKVLLFGLLGFTYSILAPLILPFLLVYFFLGYVVYRNQILNVYCSKYETGGRIWPIVHNTTIFSLVLTQIIALGVFGTKKSPVAFGFTIPLVILTLLFNEYCTQRFLPVFRNLSAQDIMEMDRLDEQYGRMEEIHQQLHLAYSQLPVDIDAMPHDSCNVGDAKNVDVAEELS